MKDQTCPYEATAAFIRDLPKAELVPLKVGHGFSAVNNWQAELVTAYKKVVGASGFVNLKMVNNLPLNVVTATKKNDQPMVFMISGDGGWTSFDQSLAEAIAISGSPVVGLDAQKYFWNERTPNGATEDIVKALAVYQSELGRKDFILAGYSFGASVVPFIADRLPAALKAHLKGVVALSPDEAADFEIHIADMLNISDQDDKYNVIAEFKKLKAVPYLCYFGSGEDEGTRLKFSKSGIKVGVLPGNHHFNDDYPGVAKALLKVTNE